MRPPKIDESTEEERRQFTEIRLNVSQTAICVGYASYFGEKIRKLLTRIILRVSAII